ncbi:MAG: hypothetical protein ACREBU_04275 [Nitrososphaera sp.]
MREKFVLIGRRLVPWPEAAAMREAEAKAVRSCLPGPMVIRDALDGVVNPCDGKPYSSKRAYYKAVKDAGCHIVGNEAEKIAAAVETRPPPLTEQHFIDGMKKVEAGYKPAPLEHIDDVF